jgi:hypothetical protein
VLTSGITFAFIYVILLAVRVAAAEKGETLLRSGMWLGYLACILAHARAICETIILVPLLTACLKQFTGEGSPPMLAISALSLLMYIGVVYPILLYCSCDASFLSPNEDRKFSAFNAELLLTIFKPIFILVATIDQKAMPYISAPFFIIYVFLLVKSPFYAHEGQSLKRAFISALAFECLARTLYAIMSDHKGSVLT